MREKRGHLPGPSLLPHSFSILKRASVLHIPLSALSNAGALHPRGRTHGTGRSGVQTLESDRWGACPPLISCESELPSLSTPQFFSYKTGRIELTF